MSPTEMRKFWIEFQTEGEGLRIEVGRGEDAEGFMSRSWSENPATSWPPTHFALASYIQVEVDFRICTAPTTAAPTNAAPTTAAPTTAAPTTAAPTTAAPTTAATGEMWKKYALPVRGLVEDTG